MRIKDTVNGKMAKKLLKKIPIDRGNAKEETKEKTKEKELILYLIIGAFMILILPHLIRFFGSNATIMGEQAYYHARAAEKIIEGNFDPGRIAAADSLVYGGRRFAFMPYHLILAFFGSYLGIEVSSKLLPFIFGILSAILFYHMLKGLKL